MVESGCGRDVIAEAATDGVQDNGGGVGFKGAVATGFGSDRAEHADASFVVGEGVRAPASALHAVLGALEAPLRVWCRWRAAVGRVRRRR
ncbi:hypothetical protein [Streptomyces sp. PanSC9]|uniref:hypothetical protein n=1 Tax=Streptomyces sp. PanSC9 TaxID=1520461 RepID=UPI00161A96D0|nr:hypothetical protein [Streptomyces sp. PanSC9]